jgi:L-malate glycosyltransferase
MPVNRRILHQFLAGATAGDAITEQALIMRRWLRDMGFQSEIFAWHIHTSVESEIRPLTAYRRGRSEQWAIYRHSIGSDVPDFLAGQALRLILIYHNITPPEFFEGSDPMRARIARLGRAQLDLLQPMTGLTLADSAFNAGDLRQAGFPGPQVLPISLPVDRFDFLPDEKVVAALAGKGPCVLFIGRIAPNKRQEDLVRLLVCLRRIQPQAHLVLVGDRWVVGYDTWIEQLAGQMGVRDRVTLTGKVSHEVMLTYLQTADCYVSMSEHEGFGVPLIESMTMGLPVVAYGTTAVPDTMGDAGVLFYHKDFEACAELIDLICNDHTLRRRIVARQKERAEFFLESRVRRQFERYLEGVGLC